MEMTDVQRRLWERISDERESHGVPQAICSAITPFPFWGVIAAIVVFIPLALVLTFFVKRHAILVQAGSIVVLDLSFWRYSVLDERISTPLGSAEVELAGNKLTIDGQRFHLEPGWSDGAKRLLELNAAAA